MEKTLEELREKLREKLNKLVISEDAVLHDGEIFEVSKELDKLVVISYKKYINP